MFLIAYWNNKREVMVVKIMQTKKTLYKKLFSSFLVSLEMLCGWREFLFRRHLEDSHDPPKVATTVSYNYLFDCNLTSLLNMLVRKNKIWLLNCFSNSNLCNLSQITVGLTPLSLEHPRSKFFKRNKCFLRNKKWI